jgi:hypothetical protein
MEADGVGRIFALSGTSFFHCEMVPTRISYAFVCPTARLPYLNVVQSEELQIAVGWFEGARSPAPLENLENVFTSGPQFTIAMSPSGVEEIWGDDMDIRLCRSGRREARQMARNENWTVRLEAIDLDGKTLEMPRTNQDHA